MLLLQLSEVKLHLIVKWEIWRKVKATKEAEKIQALLEVGFEYVCEKRLFDVFQEEKVSEDSVE